MIRSKDVEWVVMLKDFFWWFLNLKKNCFNFGFRSFPKILFVCSFVKNLYYIIHRSINNTAFSPSYLVFSTS